MLVLEREILKTHHRVSRIVESEVEKMAEHSVSLTHQSILLIILI